MTATFWTGSSLSFTNGSKTVTVNTGPSLDSVKANSALTAGNYNEPVEVKSVSGNTITLYNNWPGSTGTTSATIKPSAAAAASAGVAAQQLITEIQNLVGSASATATANSFVKRDSNGRIKAASPSSNDDVVTKGYLGSGATRDVISASNDTSVGKILTNVADFNFFALRDFGDYYPSANPKDIDAEPAGSSALYSTAGAGTYPLNPFAPNSGFVHIQTRAMYTGEAKYQLSVQYEGTNASNDAPNVAIRVMDNAGEGYTPWATYLHTLNTNLDVFGLATGGHSVVAVSTARKTNEILFYLPINSHKEPTGISVDVGFNIRGEDNLPIGNENLTLSGTFSSLLSSPRYAVLIVSGLVNLEIGKKYRLQTVNNLSKLKVNF